MINDQKRRRGVYLVIALFFWSVQAAAAEPLIENGRLLVRFDVQHGGIAAFVDKTNGHDFVGENAASENHLWHIVLGGDAPRRVTPADATEFRWESGEDALMLTWSSFNGVDLEVIADIALDNAAPLSQWRVTVKMAGDASLHAVHFPRIPNVSAQPDEVLAAPLWMGQKTTQARAMLSSSPGQPPKRFQWDYPGHVSMQCMTVYREGGPGLYVACDDTASRRKGFSIFGGMPGQLGIEVVQMPEGITTRAYQSPYAVLLGTIEGDWMDAALRYRAWAVNQPWARESRLRRGLVQQWVKNTGLWVWNRGRSENVLKPAAQLQEYSGIPISVFWHWWHGCAYDVGFPEYFPPREGEEPFREAVAAAAQQGIHALIYMNQRLWGMETDSWRDEGAERYAVKGFDGAPLKEVYNTFTKSPCAPMCLGTSFWRDKYAGLAEHAVMGLGVAGIYMDQACLSLSCFDPTHGHPIGGGAYWVAGFRELADDIRRRCAPRGVTLSGEGCGETWLPHLDLMLSLQVSMERYAAPGAWEPIPFFHAVYHEYVLCYGNYSSLTMPPYDELWPGEFAPKTPLALLDRKFSQQFYMEQARAFVWGQQPTIANIQPNQFKERPEEIEYALRLCRLRQQARPYLVYGRFLRPPKINAPVKTIDISRLSIYAGQQDALREYRKEYPPALAGAYACEDGGVAVAVASISNDSVSFLLSVDAAQYPIPDSGTIWEIEDDAKSIVGRFEDGKVSVQVKLPPRGARIYEFR